MEEKERTKYSFWDLGGKPTPLDRKMKLESSHKEKRMRA
jgi:hypothetical protein